jgi:hypothetical protein
MHILLEVNYFSERIMFSDKNVIYQLKMLTINENKFHIVNSEKKDNSGKSFIVKFGKLIER